MIYSTTNYLLPYTGIQNQFILDTCCKNTLSVLLGSPIFIPFPPSLPSYHPFSPPSPPQTVLHPPRHLLTSQTKPPRLRTIELHTLLRALRTRRPAPVTQQHTVITLSERVLQTAPDALVRVHAGEEERLDAVRFEEVGAWGGGAPEAGHAVLVDPGVRRGGGEARLVGGVEVGGEAGVPFWSGGGLS